MIDHVVVSNELAAVFVPGSVQLRKDLEDQITDYALTTSDHYPVVTRYNLSAALPVQLLDFTATRHSNTVLLNWKTASESNSSHFIIERSTDGKNFASIGTVAAAGTSNRIIAYQFTDAAPLEGNNFYRLKQMDKDGSPNLSQIVRVAFGPKLAYTFGPNPAKGRVTISLENNPYPVTVQLTDLNGKLVKQQLVPASQTQAILYLNGITKGIYLLKMVTGQGVQTGKLMVE